MFTQRVSAGFVFAFCAVAMSTADAAIILFDIDPSQSSLTLGGSTLGFPFQDQDPGPGNSLFTVGDGTITADLNPGDITIQSANVIALDSGNWLPDGSLALVPAPANWAFFVNAGVLGTANGAIRNATQNLSSSTQLIIGTSFNATGITATITTGVLDFLGTPPALSGLTNSYNLATLSGANAPATGTIQIVGLQYELTIPVNVTYTQGPFTANFVGQVVAYALVPTTTALPEPTTLALFGLGAIGLAMKVRRRRTPA